MATKAKAKAKQKSSRRLINHRDVSELFGTSPRNWRRWVNSGEVPLPHQSIGTMLLYDRAVIDHRLETGKWPDGVQFMPGSAADQISRSSGDAIQ